MYANAFDYMYYTCTLYVLYELYMYYLCTIHMLYMNYICFIYVLYIYDI